MSFGITKTIPIGEGKERVAALFQGPVGESEFHMAGQPSRLNVGDYVYTIYQNQMIGRLRITRIEPGYVNPKSGKARSLIFVETPGELLPVPVPKQGHQGTRYTDGSDWPETQG